MLWTKNETQIHALPSAAGSPIIARNANTVIVRLTLEEAVGLVAEISKSFGIESVPSEATFSEIALVIENPDGFYPADRD